MPWESKKWPTIKQRMSDKITSMIDLDSRITAQRIGKSAKLRPRQVSEKFTEYYDNYARSIESGSASSYPVDTAHNQQYFIDKVLPMMQKLIIDGPKNFRKFTARIVTGDTNLVLSRIQTATIIACMWFDLFTYPYLSAPRDVKNPKTNNLNAKIPKLSDFPEPTLVNCFINSSLFPLSCMIEYFTRLEQYLSSTSTTDDDSNEKLRFMAGNIIIKRTVMSQTPDWATSNKPLIVKLLKSQNTKSASEIADVYSRVKLKIASAHDILGGDMFGAGISQEEVMMLTYPECLVATLFCPILLEGETITVFGTERFSNYSGNGGGVRWAGPCHDETPLGYSSDDTEVMYQNGIIFMDAGQKTSMHSQLIDEFGRDLDKAYCGLSSLKFKKRETVLGVNWTYGFNGNDMQIKFIQQLLAAGQSDKMLLYSAHTNDFEENVEYFINWIVRSKLTVGDLFCAYLDMCRDYMKDKSIRRGLDVFSYISSLG